MRINVERAVCCLRVLLDTGRELTIRRHGHRRNFAHSSIKSPNGRKRDRAFGIGIPVLAASATALALSRFNRGNSSETAPTLRADSSDQHYVLFRGRPVQADQDILSGRNQTSNQLGPDLGNGNGNGNVTEEQKEDPENAWSTVTTRLSSLRDGFTSLPDKVVGLIVPDWVRVLPGFINKLQSELDMAPGSLAEEVWQEAHDPEVNPEICWEATVRVSNDLCDDEQVFLKKRKQHTRAALARYLKVPITEIHPDDVPTIAMCGSGGGLRALVAGSSSYLSAKEAGLFDCLTYTAGVSGTCWLQALYYSSITGQSHDQLLHHLKNRLGVHIAYPPTAANLLTSAPTNKYLLSGLIEKLKGVPEADFGIVDIYGLLLAARLFVPKGELNVTDYDMKVSNQRRFISHGEQPLPIYTAVRHEIPESERHPSNPEAEKRKAQKEDWFQWFEFTPHEFWCEELSAGIPTWAVGRPFMAGRTKWRDNNLSLPEVRVPLLLGVWGSAFCATLSHYYQEIRPIVKNLAGFGGIDHMMTERDEDLVKVHMIDPATIPNYVIGMRGSLSETVPQSLFKEERLKLMDAGMSNNLPIYPLLRPGRDVDMIIAFDVSAEAKKDNWLHVVAGYARQRGIKGWPIGAGWPTGDVPTEQVQKELDTAHQGVKREAESSSDTKPNFKAEPSNGFHEDSPQQSPKATPDLTYCNVWVGHTTERRTGEEPPPSKLVENDMDLMTPDAGICVIYFPLLPNPKVEDVDPQTSSFMSTWNFVYTPEQVEKVVDLARANFDEGAEQTKRAVRAVWERKKRLRLEREKAEGEELEVLKAERRRGEMRSGRGYGRKITDQDHGDHFS